MAAPRPVDRNELMSQARGHVASQATTIEQSRAVAQVQGALIVAQQRPRDTMAAAQRMREACANHRLAERAFFKFPRGGQSVSGPSIHLAAELARCWGNIDYGITELRRDEEKSESEMLAYAWDLETNLRCTNSFIVPHRRDTTRGAVDLVDMRDIYENNANNAARRLRECIFRTIPRAYTDEAQELCRETLEKGSGEPIEKQREKLVEAFGALGISPRRIARRVGKNVDKLTAFDLGELRIAYRSIKIGEADAGELFPDESGADAADELKAARNSSEEPMREIVKIVPEAGKTPIYTGSLLGEAGAAYSKVKAKAADKAAVAAANIEALRVMVQYATGEGKAKIENEIAAVEAMAGNLPGLV